MVAVLGLGAAFAGGWAVGHSGSHGPTTLSEAIQQANTGKLPLGKPAAAPSAPSTTPTLPGPPPPAALYNVAFFGVVSSVSSSQLDVQTRAGQVAVQLSGNTHVATVNLAASSRSSLTSGRVVVVIPATAPQSSSQATAGTVVVLPN